MKILGLLDYLILSFNHLKNDLAELVHSYNLNLVPENSNHIIEMECGIINYLNHRIMRKLLNKMRHRSENPCGKEGCELLIDTGTYLTYVPREMYKVSFYYHFTSISSKILMQPMLKIVMPWKNSQISISLLLVHSIILSFYY